MVGSGKQKGSGRVGKFVYDSEPLQKDSHLLPPRTLYQRTGAVGKRRRAWGVMEVL
jgi:hypothetical protein